VEDTVRWLRHALTGLDYCHRRGLLHRDVTPNNIFLDEEGHARLGDFGTAELLDADGYAGRHGNQRVVAPEAFISGRMNAASEIFSAGVTAWRMLTGEWPYEAATEPELLDQMQRSDRPRLTDRAPHVPRQLALTVECCLDPDPKQRFSSAAQLRQALENVALSARRWRPAAPHEGHIRCWRGDFVSGEVAICVCPEDTRNVRIESRRSGGRRITAGCMTLKPSRLGVELRRLFREL